MKPTMIKYSAGYIKVNPNFVIENICEEETDNCLPAFSIVHNILTRGCPTIPSRRLRDKNNLGPSSLDKWDDFNYILDFSNLSWQGVIKGGDTSNPALNFYYGELANFPGIKNEYVGSFIPECSMTDFLYKSFCANDQGDVDFYSPVYKRVIEIQGGQHYNDPAQRSKDALREIDIKSGGATLSEIPTVNIRNLFGVKPLIENTDYTDKLRPATYLNDVDRYYLFAIRLEVMLIDLYMKGDLKLSDSAISLNLHTEERLPTYIAKLIIDDFYDLLSCVLELQNIEFTKPVINLNYYKYDNFSPKKDEIYIDISIFKVYSMPQYENVYYIRNDYFQYEEKMYFDEDNNNPYLYKKNYYNISFNKVSYELDENRHRKALEYLLLNTSRGDEYIDGFKENQLTIIVSLLNTGGVFGVLPTGAGKSLCYQLASMLIPSMTLVIAPLQLLMTDQARAAYKHFGISNVAVINSSNGRAIEMLERKQSSISFISPERFFNSSFSKILASFKDNHELGFVVVDEIHCLSEWGHDFRTSYLCLSHKLKDFFPASTYLMALTGTASYQVYEDVTAELKSFKGEEYDIEPIFANSMKRDNLTIKVIKVTNYYKEIKRIVKEDFIDRGQKDKMLIFTKVRKRKDTSAEKFDYDSCEEIKDRLNKDFEKFDLEKVTDFYVGGDDIEDDKKTEILEMFDKGDKKLIVATKAFGMGVDIPDIRTTIHCGIPSSLESLYQEMGRAGRDKKHSICYVLYKEEEAANLRQFFNTQMRMDEIEKNRKKLKELSTNFYFIENNNLDPEVERDLIILVKNTIENDIADFNGSSINVRQFYNAIKDAPIESNVHKISVDEEKPFDSIRPHIEKALYRLFLLGEINMWNVVYGPNFHNPTYIDLSPTALTDKEKLEQLENHISRYNTKFDFSDKPNTFENRMDALIEWANNNFLKSRIRSIENLYDQCAKFTSSDDFMEYISSYFSNEEAYTKLVDDSLNFNYWFKVLSDSPKLSKPRISRLLESYNDLPSVNYVSGVINLISDTFESKDGRARLNSAIKDISNNISEKNRQRLFLSTYKILKNDDQKNIFTEIWLNYFDDSVWIYKQTQNYYAAKTAEEAYLKSLLETDIH